MFMFRPLPFFARTGGHADRGRGVQKPYLPPRLEKPLSFFFSHDNNEHLSPHSATACFPFTQHTARFRREREQKAFFPSTHQLKGTRVRASNHTPSSSSPFISTSIMATIAAFSSGIAAVARAGAGAGASRHTVVAHVGNSSGGATGFSASALLGEDTPPTHTRRRVCAVHSHRAQLVSRASSPACLGKKK